VAIAALPAAVAAIGARRPRNGAGGGIAGGHSRRGATPRWLVWGCAAIALAAGAGVVARGTSEPLADWDGRMIWAPAARWICAERDIAPAALVEKRWSVSHPDYPPLLPIADCVAIELARAREGAEPYRLLYALQLPALLAVSWTAAARWAGRRQAWLAMALIALAPFPAWNPDGGATGAYSDLGLAVLFGGAMVMLARPRSLGDGLIAGLLLAGAALAKKEGVWLAGGALACGALGALSRPRRGRRFQARAWLAAAVLGGLACLALYTWAARIPPRGDESYWLLARRQSLAAALAGGLRAVPEALRQMAAPSKWSLLWWVAPLLVALGAGGALRRRFAPLWLAGLLPLAIAGAACALQPDPVGLAAVTWNRFLLQALVPWTTVVALALRAALARPGTAQRA
jgi:hypothetical protein